MAVVVWWKAVMHVVIFCLLVLRCCIYCYHPPAVEHHSCIGDGLILIPEHRIAICLLPKVATTTWKFIAMVLAGQDPKEVCGCVQNEWGCLGGRINDHRVTMGRNHMGKTIEPCSTFRDYGQRERMEYYRNDKRALEPNNICILGG